MIFITVAIIFFLDRFTKIYFDNNLPLNHQVPLIKGVLSFTLVHNRGAAFGMLMNQLPVFIFSALLAIILIYFNLKKNRGRGLSLYNFSLSLILAGALGNLFDRIRFGYVIDFIDLGFWPVFNIADSAITLGAILLGWHILFAGQKDKTCIL
ncbi:MAG: signal peptidase II [Candidatus Omnitrophica bacterium]|nr:signal peptidase II [Candidatus Omnitrophota bacterium]